MKLMAETMSRKCARSIHLRRATTWSSIIATCAAGPPNAVKPSRRNSRAISVRRDADGQSGAMTVLSEVGNRSLTAELSRAVSVRQGSCEETIPLRLDNAHADVLAIDFDVLDARLELLQLLGDVFRELFLLFLGADR